MNIEKVLKNTIILFDGAIMIAHRHSTLTECENILEVNKGMLTVKLINN
jgi:hypothetical protein